MNQNKNAITLYDLKSHRWNCAEILRGSAVDRTDWKAYILPLLFFKRICDVWDEETAEAARLFGDVDPLDFPEVHRFNVPKGCHWREINEVDYAILANPLMPIVGVRFSHMIDTVTSTFIFGFIVAWLLYREPAKPVKTD